MSEPRTDLSGMTEEQLEEILAEERAATSDLIEPEEEQEEVESKLPSVSKTLHEALLTKKLQKHNKKKKEEQLQQEEKEAELVKSNIILAEEPEPPNKKEHEKKKSAVKARWMGEKAVEQQLAREVYDMNCDEALDLLARMRRNVEIVAKLVNEKMSNTDMTAKCSTCNGPKPDNKQWRLIRPLRHPITLLPYNEYYCSDVCVARANQKKQGGGPLMLSDRGMSRGSAV